MSKPNPRPDLDFQPVRNGIDFLYSAIEHLTKGPVPSDRDLKYAVLHLHAAAEVLLKARLVREYWALVFQDPGAADPDAFEAGKFKSCTLESAVDRLDRMASVTIADKDQAAVKVLSEDRNALMHYGHTANAYRIEARAARVLSFLLDFIHCHLEHDTDHDYDGSNWLDDDLARLRVRLGDITTLVTNRMNELSSELAPLADRTVQCPECSQWAYVIPVISRPRGSAGRPASDLTCRFCRHQWMGLFDVAAEYGAAVAVTEFEGARTLPRLFQQPGGPGRGRRRRPGHGSQPVLRVPPQAADLGTGRGRRPLRGHPQRTADSHRRSGCAPGLCVERGGESGGLTDALLAAWVCRPVGAASAARGAAHRGILSGR